MMDADRIGLIVWLTDLKNVNKLEQYGNLVYVSKKMKYAIVYINSDEQELLTSQLKKLGFVRKIEQSLNLELKNHFFNSLVTNDN
jgi:uncharacterized protein YlbG (UPF0298 family)